DKITCLEAIIEHVPSALFVKDGDFKVTFWNRAAEEMFGRPKETVIGRSAEATWPKEQAEAYRRDDLRVANEGRLIDIKQEASSVPGRGTIWLHTKKVALSPPLKRRGSPLLLCISEDITERKKLEAELRAAIDARDEFLSVASHELRTPVSALA